MTRVLFSCVPGDGHFHPLLPLAHAFRDAGHEVAFASAPAMRERVEPDGFEFLPAGMDAVDAQARFAPFRAELDALPVDERRAFIYPRLFGRIEAPAKLAELRAIVGEWEPELLVHESCDLAAPVAAAEGGIPTVHHSFGRAVPRAAVERAAVETEPLWQEVGLEPEPHAGLYRGVYVDIAPPSFQTEELPAGARVETLRPVPRVAAFAGELPDWLAGLPARPTVYVTLGTVMNDLAVFRVLLDGLAGLDCNVVGTVGRNRDPQELGPLPTNARVERYIAQNLLLPRCDAVVSHAGSGATLGALAQGLPMLLVPQGADQFENAERCEAVGAAKRILPDELSADVVHAAVEELLADPSYRRSAGIVAAEIEAMPEPAALVPVLLAAA